MLALSWRPVNDGGDQPTRPTLGVVDRRAWLLSIVAAVVIVAAGVMLALPDQSRPAVIPRPPTLASEAIPVPPSIAPEDLYAAFGSPGKGMSFGRAVATMVEKAGHVVLPTGRLVASDAFIIDALPFTTVVPPGRHPVSILRVDLAGPDRRAGVALVRVAPDEPVRWELALVEGQDPGVLGPGEFFGYGVDGGTGSFTSPEATERLKDLAAYRTYSEALMAGLNPDGGVFPLSFTVEVDPASGANVVAFPSGFGDGAYPSFIGFDRHGRPVVVLTDFGVLDAVGA
jgi:Protein of unknown function (DUF4241)